MVQEAKDVVGLPIKYLDIEEFVTGGYLQEANRRFFHPLGLSLEVRIDADGYYSIQGVWDYRDDKDGMRFAPNVIDQAKRVKIDHEWTDKYPIRVKSLGYVIQRE